MITSSTCIKLVLPGFDRLKQVYKVDGEALELHTRKNVVLFVRVNTAPSCPYKIVFGLGIVDDFGIVWRVWVFLFLIAGKPFTMGLTRRPTHHTA